MSDYKPMSKFDAPVDPARCRESVVAEGRSWRSRQCTRKVVRDGYCIQHHPDTIAERARQQQARWLEQERRNTRVLIETAIARLRVAGYRVISPDGKDLTND